MKINEEMDYYRYSFSYNTKPKTNTLDFNKDDSDYVHIPSQDVYEGFSLYNHDENFTVCCGVKISEMHTDCFCEVPIFLDDLLDFDKKVRDDAQMYTNDSECHTCAFYYEPKCPAYREVLTEYTRNRSAFSLAPYINSISGCSNYTYYRNVPVSIREE
jgi:hypothetical protein